MKLLLPLFPLLSMFLISCGGTKPLIDENIGDVDDSNITRGFVNVELYSMDKSDTATSTIEYAFYTTPQFPYQDSVNQKIQKYISGSMSMVGPEIDPNAPLSKELMQNALDSFAASYYAELSLYEDEEYFGGIWSSDIHVDIIEAKSEYVEVSMNGWQYSGGAHGSSWSEEALFDLKTGRNLKLADFISDLGELNAIAEVIFRLDQEIGPETDLTEAGFWFEDGIFQLNENFVFNGETLDFLFNQYEIAPYAAGMIILSIPRDKIKHLIKRKVD